VVARAVSRYLFDPAGTLTGVATEHGCSRKTVKRWLGWTAAIAEPETVLSKVVEAADAPLVPRHAGTDPNSEKENLSFFAFWIL
jgi:hypothetical protein